MTIDDMVGMGILGTYAALTALELATQARGAGRVFPRIAWWRAKGLLAFVVLMAINAALPTLLPTLWMGEHRLVDLRGLPLAAQVALAYAAVTFVTYWVHRSMHRVGFLWRHVHQLHHAPLRMDLPGAAYLHPLETVFTVGVFTVVTTLALRVTPTAAAITGYVGALYAMVQHLDVPTPRWLGYLVQRPEAHCVHHARDVHAANYSDLPLWDMVFGTFHGPDTWQGEVGFEPSASARFGAMLVGADVQNPTLTATILARPQALRAEVSA